ncbi:MAG: glycosyltransferase [Pseudomonadota bacterium]|nr:glycosyltransferase [Pseudomonadota bacterium]
MKVAVITPYYKEQIEVLRKCHEGVATQTHPCTHFMIADGNPLEEVDSWPIQHVVLPVAHGDNGGTPRTVGSIMAVNQGFDAIAYLDADNWYYPAHIQTMVTLHQMTGSTVCSASRTINRLDGTQMYVDKAENDGDKHVDTSCLFLTSGAFKLAPLWAMMPKELAPNADRIVWSAIRSRQLKHAHSSEPTVAFRTQYTVHYEHVGENPPKGSKLAENSTDASARWFLALEEDDRRAWQEYFASGKW